MAGPLKVNWHVSKRGRALSGPIVRRHIDTFSRHKVALVLPVVIAVLFSTWYAISAPKTYTTWMNLWFDTATPSESSLLQLPQGETPSAQGVAQLKEFLGTYQFLISVGHRSPMAAQLARTTGARGAALDDEIATTLQKAFTVTTAGPQVVQISMSGHDSSDMAGTLRAVANEYVQEVTTSLQSRDTQTISYYQAQVQAANNQLGRANAAVAAFQQDHPGVPATDPKYSQLTEAAFQAQNSLTSQENNLQQAQLTQQQIQTPATFHVIDPPRSPVVKSNKKHEILISVAGLMAGLLISILALAALTGLDRTARNEADIDELLGAEVVASISRLPRKQALALNRARTQ
jgi:hypothetical protein